MAGLAWVGRSGAGVDVTVGAAAFSTVGWLIDVGEGGGAAWLLVLEVESRGGALTPAF